MVHITFRLAQASDISTLVSLINKSYREQQGRSWTTELECVKGQRITENQLQQQLQAAHFSLIVGEIDAQVIGCIGLTFENDQVEIGTFCTDPHIQNMGIGKAMLAYAEQFALSQAATKIAVMYVLNVRHELIAFYERRGYVPTGLFEPYPFDADVGQPLVPLQLMQMKKDLK